MQIKWCVLLLRTRIALFRKENYPLVELQVILVVCCQMESCVAQNQIAFFSSSFQNPIKQFFLGYCLCSHKIGIGLSFLIYQFRHGHNTCISLPRLCFFVHFICHPQQLSVDVNIFMTKATHRLFVRHTAATKLTQLCSFWQRRYETSRSSLFILKQR